MKIIEDRIKYLTKEKDLLLKEYPQDEVAMQMLMAMVNMRISIELSFLSELLISLPIRSIPTDKDIDDYFPLIKTQSIKDQNATLMKRNAVKSFVKNKMQ